MYTVTTFGVLGLLLAGFFFALMAGAMAGKQLGTALLMAIIGLLIMSLSL
jgi:hypothetical protein